MQTSNQRDPLVEGMFNLTSTKKEDLCKVMSSQSLTCSRLPSGHSQFREAEAGADRRDKPAAAKKWDRRRVSFWRLKKNQTS